MEVDEYRIQGNKYFKEGLYEKAINSYTKAIENNEDNPFLYGNRSAAYLMVHKFHEAYKDAKKSVSLDHSNVKYLLRCLKCCILLGEVDEAKRLCTSIRQLDPCNLDFITHNENLQVLSTNYENHLKKLADSDMRHALHLITNCIDAAPGSLNFRLQRLNVLIQLKCFNEAKYDVDSLLKSDDSVDLLYYRGLCLYYMEDLDKASAHFRHILRVHPDHTDTQKAFKRAKKLQDLRDQGNQFFRSACYSEAHKTYSAALQIDDLHDALNAKLFSNRASALFQLGRFEEAVVDCKSAIALDPNYIRPRIRLAKCYSSLGEYEKAVEEWKIVVSLDASAENQQNLEASKSDLEKFKLDYYKILGLKRNASSDEIKRAYKKSALLHHPDRHASASEATRLEEQTKFQEIGAAYSILSDPKKRRLYDMGQLSTGENIYQSNQAAHTVFTQVFPGMGQTTVHFTFG